MLIVLISNLDGLNFFSPKMGSHHQSFIIFDALVKNPQRFFARVFCLTKQIDN